MAQSTQVDVNSLLPTNENNSSLDKATSPTTRQPYRRQSSWQGRTGPYQSVFHEEDHGIAEEVAHDEEDVGTRGLGLSNVSKSAGASVVRRVPVGSRASTIFSPETSSVNGSYSQNTTARNTEDISYNPRKWATPQSSAQSLGDSFYRHEPDNRRLIRSETDYQSGFIQGANFQQGLVKERWSALTWVFIILAFYTTIFSAIFLVIAILKPRWGHRVGTHHNLSYNTATFLSALFSKSIELSFATTFVATLGQILTRRAFARSTRSKGGISIAEMNMRLWIMQPGTLITHWSGVKYVITTFIGVSALLAAFAATFYTTAAEALVSPKLIFGKNETVNLLGQVSSDYGNTVYLSAHCETPISATVDVDYSGTTCLQFDYAGNGFRNFASWRSSWAERQAAKMDVAVGSKIPRPPPISILYENTTITGQWIGNLYDDTKDLSAKYGRMFQNVTMVMPHANVYHAARDQANRILQPDDLGGSGEYYLKAAVPAPALNIICIGVDDAEILPLIANGSHYPPKWPVETPFDSYFNWVQDEAVVTAANGEYAPWFNNLPADYNTLVNVTDNRWGSEWIYLLAKASPTVVKTNNYTMCGMRSYLRQDCSTAMWETKSGGRLSVHCGDDSQVWKRYDQTSNASLKPPAGMKHAPASQNAKNWKDVGAQWIRSVSLGQGISNGNAAIARFLTQIIPAYDPLTKSSIVSPNMPSIAEGLGVLAGYTLLMSSDASPFIHFWSWDPDLPPSLNPPQSQTFESLLAYKDYSSGYDAQWKGVFYIVLAAVFVLNVFCLATLMYYYVHFGEMTDYTEPQNLFALAINSPQSRFLAGANTGAGPTGEVLGKKWTVEMARPAEYTPEPNNGQTPDASSRSPYPSQSSQTPHFFVHYPEEESIHEDLDTETAQNTAANTPNPQSRLSRFIPAPLRQRDHSGSPRPDSTRKSARFSSPARATNTSTMEQMEFEEPGQRATGGQYTRLTGGNNG